MDLTHFMNGRPIYTQPHEPQVQDLQYDMVHMVCGGGVLFRSDSTTATDRTGSTTASLSAGGGFEMDTGGGSGNGRWPRQETLTLLEVRSRLDSKFKEANQKGPLWDEVSRIMSEEHGYQRTGKKCREKFENLYKYYKKTKEGKAGRQDGKHYRFFRQLEALYGESSTSHVNPNPNPYPNIVETNGFQLQDNSYQGVIKSPSLSNNSSQFDTSSSGYSDLDKSINKRKLGKRGWKSKIKEFIDAQMRRIMEKQEEWMEKMMKSIENKEQERVLREEQWRNEEVARFEKEHKFWENERAWMESRDSALMEALHKLTGKEVQESYHKLSQNDQNFTNWGENEVTRLIQIRTTMESRFEQNGYMDEFLWDEIASKMACLGYPRTGLVCKNKWDSINEFLMRTKKRKENARSENSYTAHNNESLVSHMFHHQLGSYRPANDGLVNEQHDGNMAGDHENMWAGYGMKQTKGGDH